MLQESLGLIETIGLTAAVAAADAGVKSANVILVGYELANGDGMTVVKFRGDVGAVKAAVSAATIEAGRVGKVVSTSVIARPANHLETIVESSQTVGMGQPAAPVAAVETPPPTDADEVSEPPPVPDVADAVAAEEPAEVATAEVVALAEPQSTDTGAAPSVSEVKGEPAATASTQSHARANRRHRKR